jgi:hypothetical protein
MAERYAFTAEGPDWTPVPAGPGRRGARVHGGGLPRGRRTSTRPGPLQDLPDGGGTDLIAEAGELAVDASGASAGFVIVRFLVLDGEDEQPHRLQRSVWPVSGLRVEEQLARDEVSASVTSESRRDQYRDGVGVRVRALISGQRVLGGQSLANVAHDGSRSYLSRSWYSGI